MIFRRRSRFGALVTRQLELFAEDEAELLAELKTAEQAYDLADRENAEEAYGEFQLVIDAGAERLADLCASYEATLDADAGTEYRAVFVRAASKRFPRLSGLL